MSTVRKLAKNTVVLIVSQISSYILAFFYTIYMARYLGAEGFGLLSTAIAFAGIFAVFTDLGLGLITIRDVARDKSLASKYLGNVAIIKTILAFFTFGLIVLVANIFSYPQQTLNIIYLIALNFIFSSFAYMFQSIYQAYEKMEYLSIAQILTSFLMFLGVFIAIYYKFSIIGFAFIYLIASLVVLAYSFIICIWKFALPKIEFDWSFWKYIILEALPISLASIFALVAFRVDTVILSLIKGNLAVGWYTASYRLMEALMFVPSMYAVAIYPIFSKFHITSKESLKLSYKKSFKYLSMIGLPIAVGTTLLADKIIGLIYPTGFTESILALQILIWTIPIIFLNYVLGASITSINQQRATIRITFICMSINVILNLILIPSFSYVAASFVTVITELTLFIFYFHLISKYIYKINIPRVIIKPIIASMIMGLFIYCVNLNLGAAILISTIIYFSALIFLKSFSKEDVYLFKQIFKSK
ncbi:MAG: flippase [Euryarchaeota archaeon]|nr:flippase [Euryarchaeota archaeon]